MYINWGKVWVKKVIMKAFFRILFLLFILMMSSASDVFAIEDLRPAVDFKTVNLKGGVSLDKNFVSRKYILGPNDVISISVIDAEEYDAKSIVIPPDGIITYGPIGEINVAGKTISEVNDIITAALVYYLRDPKVTITLSDTKSFMIYVSGAVMNPGGYEMNTNTQRQASYNTDRQIRLERSSPLLSNVLVAAGGVRYDADLEHIKIKNSSDGSEFEVNLFDLLEGNTNQDIYLMAGDSVIVPSVSTPLAVTDAAYKKFAAASFSPGSIPVKVYGYVNNPGLVMLNSNLSLNINSAITQAGGYLTEIAYAPKYVFLSRVDENGILTTIKVDPKHRDFMLRPNDIVYVPEKPRPLVGKAFDYATRILTPISMFASMYNGWAMMFNPTRFYNVVSP